MTRPLPCTAPMPVRGRIQRPQARGLPVINLGYNELPHGPSPAVQAALTGAGGAANRYGSPFCDGLRADLGARFGLDPDRILCGNGSEDLLDVIGRTFARPGDEFLQARIAEVVSDRARIQGVLRQYGVEVTPSFTNFLMARPRGADPAATEALVEYLFDEAGIVVNRTREAGLESWMRFSLGLPAQNDLLLETVARFLGAG